MSIAARAAAALSWALTSILARRPDVDSRELRKRERFVRAMSGGQ